MIKGNKQKGFTMIEFLVYSVIVTMIIGAVVLTGINVIESRAKIGIMEEVNHNGRVAINIMSRYIREAKNVIGPLEQQESNYLSLEMETSANTPTVFQIEEGSEGVLTIKRGTSAEIPLMSESVQVSEIHFVNTSEVGEAQSIRIEMKLKYRNIGGREEYMFEETFYAAESLRN